MARIIQTINETRRKCKGWRNSKHMKAQPLIIEIIGASSLLAGLYLIIYHSTLLLYRHCLITPSNPSPCSIPFLATNYQMVLAGLVLVALGIVAIVTVVSYSIKRKTISPVLKRSYFSPYNDNRTRFKEMEL